MLKVKVATKQGYLPMIEGGVADLAYPSSKTRRGRVQGEGHIFPTVTREETIRRVEADELEIRIRRITPKEAMRAMGVADEDYEKMAKVNSNSQLYKQAGNSIVVDVLVALFSQLGIEGVEKWNEIHT